MIYDYSITLLCLVITLLWYNLNNV